VRHPLIWEGGWTDILKQELGERGGKKKSKSYRLGRGILRKSVGGIDEEDRLASGQRGGGGGIPMNKNKTKALQNSGKKGEITGKRKRSKTRF